MLRHAPTAPALPLRARPRARGFTLLELLVVVVIIGVLVTFVAVSVGVLGEDRELEAESRRLTDVVALALEQAQLEGRDLGLRFDDSSYEVLSFDGRRQEWRPVADDPWLARRELPAGVTFGLVLEGRPIVLKKPGPLDEPVPQVVVFASGDVIPYELTLSRPGTPQRVTLVGRADGSIEVSREPQG